MTIDVKKHTTFAAGEAPRRAALVAALLSINDVVPVANATEAAQVAAGVIAAGQSLASAPLLVSRADARGLHRIEYTFDGTVFFPASAVLPFASKTAADAFAASNSTLLTAGDRCRISGNEWRWAGTKWVPVGNGLAGYAFVQPSTEQILAPALTTVSGLTLTGMPTGLPVLLEVTVQAANGQWASTRRLDVQAMNGAATVGPARKFGLPAKNDETVGASITHLVPVDAPASDTWTLQLGCDLASAVVFWQAALRLYLRP